MEHDRRLTRLPYILGYAGLAPQVIVVGLLLFGGHTPKLIAQGLGFAYAALILSFLGGVWWGLGAARPERAPAWLWLVAIAPSLVAMTAILPWRIFGLWPHPSLLILGFALILSLTVDRALSRRGLTTSDWMRLRATLSLALGALTLIAALL